MDTVADPTTHPDSPGTRLVDGEAAEWERTYASWTHLGCLIGDIVAAFSANIGIPLIVLLALVLWLVKRDQSPFVDDHGREALNFQISLTLYTFVLLPVAALLTCGVGLLLILPIAALGIIGTAQASGAARRGEYYRYPACLRLVK
jgi:uncharacterized Tic20 family protein